MTDDSSIERYEVVVVGGGPAGLSTALYTTRLGHSTALVDRGGGRAAMMQDVHNVIGVPEEKTGHEFLSIGTEQVREYGCRVHRDVISSCDRAGDGTFELAGDSGRYVADAVVLATGFTDVRPDPPLPRTGRGLHYCLHCDAYMFIDEPVYVMGTSESAAYVAAIMLNFTDKVDLLLRGERPSWSEATATMLDNHPIERIEAEITGIQNGDDGWLEAIEFEDGSVREYRGGFTMYGADYNNGLARELGCSINDDGTVSVDDHGRTSVDGVWAVGDLTPGHNQIPVAIGEGAKAGISIHYELREFPRDPELIEKMGPVRTDEIPDIPDELLERASDSHVYADD